jgi:hypothetical protein
MGLDIYLYRHENKSEEEVLEAKYQTDSEASWEKAGEYSTLSESQKNTLRQCDKELAKSLGLEDGGEHPGKTKIEFASAKYPDHYFKVGYFRSSYNSGGINHILSNLGLPDLYQIFNRSRDDEYTFQPDWDSVKKNAVNVLKELKKKQNIRCHEVSFNEFANPMDHAIKSEADAIKCFIEEKAKHNGSYSNLRGEFFMEEPAKVLAIMPGFRKQLMGDRQLPTSYIITVGENEWYENALEIIVETCDYVLSQEDKVKFYFHWSS